MLISNVQQEPATQAVRACVSRRALLAGLSASLLLGTVAAAQSAIVRFGVLGFGTAAWELDVVRRHRLDTSNGVTIEARELAGPEAGKTALLAGSVDVVVTDWVWAARQRSEGADLAFLPYSRAVGALELPAGSSVRGLSELDGKRLGIAGGPLDKSWILLRALSLRQTGHDMAERVQPVFGAPPLLEQEFLAGRLDAVLTFWNFAARLEVKGARRLLSVAQILQGLGAPAELPMLGYVFNESWARANPKTLANFINVTKAAKSLLATSDEEWQLLAPRLGTGDPRLQAALRNAYRDGIPHRFGNDERDGAARLFSILADLGGEALVGKAKSLDPGVFWTIPA
ncbi:ABC transporter substrate-binding protein [Mesorhizobium sp. M3A.F.Ca.ET.174.01.1.1]|uniref:ABC transporter substrate-binding protein n=1 Tax=unclassified Mesorhizobium TaxID=325217 RepID=UPI0010935528|nr:MULTISPECIES: ABC transporter substrate-binding protein [unclassified Mesorhizobium]TGS65878.1 ABC transporter substrate-binding protein [Mesorhizobium sp. M3A.F.Ca.ET.201.01.1.1]TGS82208.1 ABC transporter substrate-binding protein [Mesorhizobium sp. M3A.F.Ca.ET.175.01.1.1]TGT22015.1 ABC transporter substrate-binding protein [Mesorhizobium sp. M3A.F.Ca.ET.174.01.1.1]